MTEPGLTLTDRQTYVVKQGETITASTDNRNALADVNNSATATGVQLSSGSATIQGSKIPITAQARGGTATSAYANAYANAYGFNAGTGGNIDVKGDAGITVRARGGDTATATATVEKEYAEAEAYGLYAGSAASSITIGGDMVIKTQANGGTVSGDQAKAKARSLYASGDNSSITINAAEEHTVQLTGDLEVRNKGKVAVSLTNADSFLQGNVVTENLGTVAFTVANGAVWQPLHDNRNGSFFDRTAYENGKVDSNGYQTTVNSVETLILQNGGVVDLGWDTPLRDSSWRTMTINDLTTNTGVIRINSDIIGGTGDVFEIAKVNDGDAPLGVQVGYDKASQKGWGTYEGKHTVLTGTDAQNITAYGLFYKNRAGAYTPIMEGADMVALKIEPSSNIKAAGNAAYSSLQLGTAAGNHLNKWLGELRDGYEDGVWARVYGGDLKNNANGHMKTRYKGLQGGYDKAYGENGGMGRFGGAFSYASGDLELPRGGGDNKAWDFALYKTWQGAKGRYYDLVLHYGKVDTDYHTTDLERHYSTASFDAHTLGLTVEYGYRKTLRSGWYCQPQAEVSWFRLGSADYTASSGMQVAQDSATSLQGRLGIGVGRKLANGTHYYATLSGVHEFDGKVSLRGDGLGYEQEYGGTWGEFVLGVTAPIDKRWDGYASAERLFGGDVGSTWQLNAGVRLRF
ncbi:MAG: autotransporter outer membrane beta-barrel domain-containing protein [Acidaminococcaceae bacterium]|nr:autotransporter outer membrane beta-barrel domain-containing protein [Acidaminococcaceae bacterium]